ncbi:hypothetical protein RHSIM_Rhsim13G0046700 [Rhododendron simsii]|uniref:Xyloglucan endotransglucosylase/hydrolase n=1 Tax=Rhododendron simsii TaxID=118357 RepID=A0A834G0Q6_RHOSS|nr:hypothetical protein RHSIM_Rhsim13G0046700 [Rhododendron simsii]
MGTISDQSSFFGVILFLLFGVLLGEVLILAGGASSDSSFDVNYYVTWGSSNVLSLNEGGEIQLSMDISSGFCNPKRLALLMQLTSHTDKHDELDFEFLGNREGRPYTLQTNVFSNGEGNREQRIHLWFDPTADFHDYKVLWNQHLIVFYADDIPFRVFKNNANIGVSYPTQPMQIEASLWDGDSWATDGGQTKTNWSQAPFKAHFQGFNIDGCPSSSTTTQGQCYSSNFWWNQEKYWKLDSNQQKAYENVRNNYMTYDYCSDRPRYPKPPAECLQ